MDDPYLEPIVVLGAAAAVTTPISLGTSVLIAPMRNPVLLAKQAATIDALSGGRLVLGVGVGWLREEFEALDADFDGARRGVGRVDRDRARLLDGQRRAVRGQALPAAGADLQPARARDAGSRCWSAACPATR